MSAYIPTIPYIAAAILSLCAVAHCLRQKKRRPSTLCCASLEEVQKSASTGDVLLFQWGVPGPSRLMTDMTHVGIVERRPNGSLVVWEAHAEGDAEYLGIPTGGVHVHPLVPRLRGYEGSIAWARLRHPLSPGEQRSLLRTLESLRGTPFDEAHQARFIRQCVLGLPGKYHPPKRGIFCSEFVATVFHHAIGARHTSKDAACTTPDDIIDLALHHRPKAIKSW